MRIVNKVLLLLVLAGCATTPAHLPSTDPAGPATMQNGAGGMDMNDIAEQYVRLVLAVGEHDDGYVDAFYGPSAWREEVKKATPALPDIHTQADLLISRLSAMPAPAEELVRLRRDYLQRQLEALVARVDMLSGRKMTFDEESKALYDAVAPNLTERYLQSFVDQLERELPGKGTLTERYASYRKQFAIPSAKLDAVFQAAIAECRARTKRHIDLPEGESFTVEYVKDKSWSGYNWYQGNYKSLIQVNTDLPIFIDRAIDLACHEGYPGHHVYNVLLEKHLVDDRGWVEFSVYPLYSPQSLIAEGSANYGIDVAFPAEERVRYEKETLFPLAGIDSSDAERYYRIQKLVTTLNYAHNEAARDYLDGKVSGPQAVDDLTRLGVMEPDRAAQRLRFIDQYRSYVINYNLGKDLVKDHIEAVSGGGRDRALVWAEFEKLLSSPRLPSGLAKKNK